MMSRETEYKRLFRVEEETMDRVVAAALSRGGDYADLYFENTVKQYFRLTDSKVTAGGLNTDFGVGIRTLSGIRSGYAYCETTAAADMLRAAGAAALIAAKGQRFTYGSRREEPAASYPQTDGWESLPAGRSVSFLRELEAAVAAKYPSISNTTTATL